MKKEISFTILSSILISALYADEMPFEVKRLTVLRDKKIEEIEKIYWKEAGNLKNKYARSGNIKSALYIEKMQIQYADEQEKMEKEEPSSNKDEETHLLAKNVDARIYYRGDTMRFKKETAGFETRGGVIGSVPDEFNGDKISTVHKYTDYLKEEDKGSITFKVKRAGTVYMVVEDSKQFIEDSWSVVDQGTYGWGGIYKRGFKVLSKTLEVGEYTLPKTAGFGTRIIDR